MNDLVYFIKERFPLKASIPLAVVLFLAPFSLSPGEINPVALATGIVTSFSALLSLRIADDLSDLENDRKYHPRRGLSSGLINQGNLKRFVILTVVILMVLNSLRLEQFLFSISVPAYYVLYFTIRRRMHVFLRPFLSNAVFFFIPAYAGLISHGFSAGHIHLSLFIYTAAVSHEWAHEVKSENEIPRHKLSYSGLIGPRGSAVAAVSLFALAGIWGWMFWYKGTKPILFGAMLLLTSVQISFMGIRLVRKPSGITARPFYISGFTFFLLPLAGLLIDNHFKYFFI